MQPARAVVAFPVLVVAAVSAPSANAAPLTDLALPPLPATEVEPNNSAATAQPIAQRQLERDHELDLNRDR